MAEVPEIVECVLCCKDIDIFAVGVCNHEVCYECITRMRVLCQRNECPICRKTLENVVLVSEKKTYESIKMNQDIYDEDKRYKILFESKSIKEKFDEMLEMKCFKCQDKTFRHFDPLQSHMRKVHNLFYCELCLDNIKVFPKERRLYNRQELGFHRRKGDEDCKAHRGHPICAFCDNRFFDKDALFKHLRTDHFFCHICDANGSNDYYSEISSLSDHFQSKHFVCDDEVCKKDILTNVYKTEIDLKAHKVSDHFQSKQTAKLIRNIELDLPSRQQFFELDTPADTRSNENQSIDASDVNQFPALSTERSLSYPAPKQSSTVVYKKMGKAALAVTQENFPALQPTKRMTSSKVIDKKASNDERSKVNVMPQDQKYKSALQHNAGTRSNLSAPKLTMVKGDSTLQKRPEAKPTSVNIKSKEDFPTLSLRGKKNSNAEQLSKPNGKLDNENKDKNKNGIILSQYIKPLDNIKRNKILKEKIAALLTDPVSLKHFQEASKLFMLSECATASYVERCRVVLGNDFVNLFSELLVLLPNIQKQHELYNYVKAGNSKFLKDILGKLRKCKKCKQVLLVSDLEYHQAQHS